VHENQRALLQRHLDTMGREARAAGLTDQDVAEWLLGLGARWLCAHGVSPDAVLQWTALTVKRPVVLRPMGAAARAKNDFGGGR